MVGKIAQESRGINPIRSKYINIRELVLNSIHTEGVGSGETESVQSAVSSLQTTLSSTSTGIPSLCFVSELILRVLPLPTLKVQYVVSAARSLSIKT